MNVAYVFDEGFASCAAVSMYSLMKNNKHMEQIVFYVLDDGISDMSKEKINKMINAFGRKIVYIDTSAIAENLEKMGVQPWRGRYSTYMKLFFASDLDNGLERILVIDADTIVDGKLDDLEKIDLGSYPCAMALEGIHGRYHKYNGLGGGGTI